MSEKIKELRRNTEDAMRFFEKNLAYTLGPVELKEMLVLYRKIILLTNMILVH